MTEHLNQEWKNLRQELSKNRVEFGQQYRNLHKYHNCNSKVYAHNGNWFCNHLTNARNRQFKEKIERVDEIISLMVSTTN